MKLYEYESYAEYLKCQVATNLAKLNNVYVQPETLDVLAEKLQEKLGMVNTGICHGTRNGFEQRVLREKLNADVFGTEISPTANQFAFTVQWDFHEVKEEWLGAFDFIYSNSLDHSYSPLRCFEQWLRCIRSGGYCILHWTVWNLKSNRDDPFGATLGEFIDLAMPPTPVRGNPKRLNLPPDRYLEEVCRVEHTQMRKQGPDYLIWVKKT